MGEPATEMDVMDSAKDLRGLDLGLKKAMASDLDGLRWRPLFRSQLWTLWVQARFYQSDLMCERRQVCTNLQLSVTSVLMEGHNVTGTWQVRIYDTGDRWYEENKKKCAKDRALGNTCEYCRVGWGWRVNFNKGCAVSQIGANPGDDIVRQTESMLKSVEKCGMVESIKCSGHVESSQNCDFSRVNWFSWCHLWVWAERSQSNGICDRQTAKGRNWEIWISEERDEPGRDVRAFCQ